MPRRAYSTPNAVRSLEGSSNGAYGSFYDRGRDSATPSKGGVLNLSKGAGGSRSVHSRGQGLQGPTRTHHAILRSYVSMDFFLGRSNNILDDGSSRLGIKSSRGRGREPPRSEPRQLPPLQENDRAMKARRTFVYCTLCLHSSIIFAHHVRSLECSTQKFGCLILSAQFSCNPLHHFTCIVSLILHSAGRYHGKF